MLSDYKPDLPAFTLTQRRLTAAKPDNKLTKTIIRILVKAKMILQGKAINSRTPDDIKACLACIFRQPR